MELINLTRRVEIGANSYLLKIKGHSVIIDAGLHPKDEGLAATPDYSQVPAGTVQTIIVSPTHQDTQLANTLC